MVHQVHTCIHMGSSGTFWYQGIGEGSGGVAEVLNGDAGSGYTRFCGLTAGTRTAMIPGLPVPSSPRARGKLAIPKFRKDWPPVSRPAANWKG